MVLEENMVMEMEMAMAIAMKRVVAMEMAKVMKTNPMIARGTTQRYSLPCRAMFSCKVTDIRQIRTSPRSSISLPTHNISSAT